MKRLAISMVVASALASSAHAQYDNVIIGPSLDTAQSITNEVVAREINKEIVSADVAKHSTAARGSQVSKRPINGPSVSLSYIATVQASSSAQQSYVARLATHDPASANLLQQQMHAHDFGQVYAGIVAPFGLRRGDVGDAMAAYTLLGWMIATGSTDPTREQVRAMRERIAAGIAAEPKFADSTTRAALGEEIVISFVTLHAGWQSAQREGKVQQYSDGVAAMFQKQTGNDLRQLVLTDRGLEKRG